MQNMDYKDMLLKAMREAGGPPEGGRSGGPFWSATQEVDKIMKQLKAEGAIVSPVRCKWTVNE